MRTLSTALLPAAAAAVALRRGSPLVDPRTGLEEAGWDDDDIVLDEHKWWRLPRQAYKPGDPRPYPPTDDYHSEGVRNASKVAVLIASLDETKVIATLKTMFERAQVPSRVYAGVVQQNSERTRDALEGLCEELGTPLELKEQFRGRVDLNRRQKDEDAWGHSRYTPESFAACGPASRVRMYRMTMQEAKGPAYARGRQPILLGDGGELEDFCMQIDAHTVFTPGWDENAIKQWAATDNEYAVLSTYPTNAAELQADGSPTNTNNHWEMPHICSAKGGGGLIRNDQASAVAGLTRPALTKFWAAGLSFSKCHAERDVPADPNLMHIFTGEEFGRGARLWTSGYDFYSPARPIIGTWYGAQKGNGNWNGNVTENEAAKRRLRALWGQSDEEQPLDLKGYELGTRRSLEAYVNLAGVDPMLGEVKTLAPGVGMVPRTTPCSITRWTPWREGSQAPYQALEGSPASAGKDAVLRAMAFD
mmetsp:Transcript_26754/g.69953  ORF Transcript_26754/g.69953 Transcript_26754/m.69953 type:complete len:476 (+) Transcript_26754:101-1528(+)